jgi:hypothetical protein
MIGCITTVLLLNLSFYQHVQNKGYINKTCTHGSFFFTVVGSIGLIMLSVLDNITHHFMHDVCVTIFMYVLRRDQYTYTLQRTDCCSVGFLLSAALMCLDYIYLGMAHALREPLLMTSFVIKSSFIVVELGLIIVFRITEHTHYQQNNMAATLEWGKYIYICSPRL